MNTQAQSFLSSFDLLPEPVKAQVVIEILTRFDSDLTVGSAIRYLRRRLSLQPTYPLRGKPVRIADPFGPAVPVEDWSVLS